MTMRKLAVFVPIAAAVFGLAACAPTGTTVKEPALAPPAGSPAIAAPTNPVTGTVPGPNSSGASPTAPGGGGGASGGAGGSGT